MKYFVKRRQGPASAFSTEGVLQQVCSGIGTQMFLTEIRDRIKILDEVEKPGRYIALEDAQHKKLCQMIEAMQFSVAHRDLLVIINDVLEAGDAVPPEPVVEDAQQTGN